MPWFDYINEALAFAGACYANGWVDPSFNWLEWVPQGIRHTDAPE